jgi:hypothetical protein
VRLRNVGAGIVWGRIVPDEKPAVDARYDMALPGLKTPDNFEGNDVTLEVALDTSQVSLGAYSGALLVQTDNEVVRLPVDYTVQGLQLRVEPPELDFGTVLVGKRRTRKLRVLRNDEVQGGGRPRGTIYTGASLGGLVAPERFSGDGSIEITADGGMPDAIAKSYEGALQLDTNGGRLRVPVRYSFVLPPARWLALILGAALIGAVSGAALRALYAVVNLDYAWRWLAQGGDIVPLNLTSLRAPVFVGAIAGALYSIWWTARDWDDTRPQRAGIQLFVQSLTLSALLGASLCWPMVWGLHWLFWGLGDWILLPVARMVTPVAASVPAPLAWSIVGGMAGALQGLARALTATGRGWARYVVWTFFVAVFFVLLIHAMLATP